MKKISAIRALITILSTASFTALFLLYFSANQSLVIPGVQSNTAPEEIHPALLPNDQNRIGIVSGHWGFDSGHVCAPELNSLREVDVNLRIATYLRDILTQRGYTVDLLREFDPALTDYVGLAVLAIHTDSCDYINGNATGFKVSSIGAVAYPTEAENLLDCLEDRFAHITGANFAGNLVSSDAEPFYDYSMLDPYTTAAVIEPGFLNLDYRFLTEKTELIARGIADGIVCYVRNEAAKPKRAQTYIQSAYSTHFFGEAVENATQYILPGIPGITDQP